jgi:hypothetical protein
VIPRRHLICLLIALSTLDRSSTAATAELAVEVTNASEPALCAEQDNVTLTFASPDVRRFRVEAIHPAYIDTLRADRFGPNFTDCPHELSPATTELRPPRRVTFYEDAESWLTGFTFTNYWRPHDIPFRVGDRVEVGLHVVQLWVRRNERAEEVLVVYPGDGYWRIRPLSPAHLGWSAYGSSLLVGPVEMEDRPLVKIRAIDFDPAAMTFRLAFAAGGGAVLKIDKLDRDALSLNVTLDRPVPDRPFAALRSMYVTEFSNDVARIALRDENVRAWREEPIMTFKRAKATEVWAGRQVPSWHNTSAPDMLFGWFRADRP